MDYGEFKRQLGKAGLSAKGFARLVKMNPSSITNYAKADLVPAHWAIVVSLMGEMAEHDLDFRVVLDRIMISPKKSRGALSSSFVMGKHTHFSESSPAKEEPDGWEA